MNEIIRLLRSGLESLSRLLGKLEKQPGSTSGTSSTQTASAAPAAPTPAPTPAAPPSASRPALAAGPRLLLVEDNEMNQDMLLRRLRGRGYQVELATDGEAAVRAASGMHPDLILMDMSLPVLSGWEATRRIKADERTKAIPILALTAHAMSGDRERALEAGCDDYDTKPIDFTRLLGKIEGLLVKEKV